MVRSAKGQWGVKLVAAMDEDFEEERVRLKPLSAFAFAAAFLMSGAILFNTLLGGGASNHSTAQGGSASMVVDAGDGNAQVVTMRYEPMVETLQRDLKQLGRYDGPADGVIGKRTKQAIADFQRENGLNPDGEPNEETIDRVAFALRIAEAAGFTASTGDAKGDDTVRQIQEKLAELGYEPGTADGFPGEKTREAIANFERDRGLPQTGEASPKVLAEIERLTGAAN
jgi:peptidoglycan hydrolase-like protein with peptidoglycan-binding domain